MEEIVSRVDLLETQPKFCKSQKLILAMNDQSFGEDALADDLKEPLNVQDVQEPKSATSDLNAHVDALNKPLNVLDIQESKIASSDVNALESTSFDVNFLVDALNIQDDQESKSEKKDKLLSPWLELPPELLYQVSKHLSNIYFSIYFRTSLNVLDIQESKIASSDVNALESTSFDVNFLVDALNIQDDQESKSEKKDKLLSPWLELPPELLYQVSKHLSNIYFSIFCAVCKSWRSSAQSWHSNHLVFRLRTLLDIPHSESPCNLMTLDTNQEDIPVLGVRLHCSKMGWLLLSLVRFEYCRFFFFNPFTMVKIELPSNFYPFDIMSFSLPPTSKDCFVVGIARCGYEFGIIRRGEESWNIFDFKRSLPKDIFISHTSPVLYKGRCYCLCMSGELGVFDLNEYLRNPEGQNSFRWIQIVPRGFSEELVDSIIQCYLVESNGQLYSVFEFEDFNPCFLVFSLNPNKSQLKWHAAENLRSQIFYVGVVGSISEPAMVGGVGNKIYLPNVQDNRCVFYNLKTKRCQSLNSDYSTSISPHGKEHSNYFWIKRPLADSG